MVKVIIGYGSTVYETRIVKIRVNICRTENRLRLYKDRKFGNAAWIKVEKIA